MSNRLGRHDEAIGYYRKMLEGGDLVGQSATYLRYNIAKILQQAGRLDEAIDEYGRLLAGGLDAKLRATVRVNRGGAYLFSDRMTEAAADSTAVIDDPEAPADQKAKALVNRSTALNASAPAQALQDIDDHLALGLGAEQEQVSLQFNRINLLRRLGNPNAAWHQLLALEADERLSEEMKRRLARLKVSLPARA